MAGLSRDFTSGGLASWQTGCGPCFSAFRVLMVKLCECPILLHVTYCFFAMSSAVSPGSSSSYISIRISSGSSSSLPWSSSSVICVVTLVPRSLVDGRHGVPCISSIPLASNLCPSGCAVTDLTNQVFGGCFDGPTPHSVCPPGFRLTELDDTGQLVHDSFSESGLRCCGGSSPDSLDCREPVFPRYSPEQRASGQHN